MSGTVFIPAGMVPVVFTMQNFACVHHVPLVCPRTLGMIPAKIRDIVVQDALRNIELNQKDSPWKTILPAFKALEAMELQKAEAPHPQSHLLILGWRVIL
jgi:hypothetical protein